MDAQTLHVEWLESRCLLNIADALAALASGPTFPDPTGAPVPRVLAVAASLDLQGPQALRLVQDGIALARNAGAQPPSILSAVSPPVDLPESVHALVSLGDHIATGGNAAPQPATILSAVPPPVDLADALRALVSFADHYADARPPVPQLQHEEAHAPLRDRPDLVSGNSISSGAAGGTSDDRFGMPARASGETMNAPVALKLSGEVPDERGCADAPPLVPTDAAPPDTAASDHGAGAPAGSAPPSLGAWIIPVDCEAPSDSSPPHWRNVLLDPLAGVPVRDVVAVNLSALGTEMETFAAHLDDLRSETDAAAWGESLWFAAGAVLLGGAYFARRANARGTDARTREPTGPSDPSEDAP